MRTLGESTSFALRKLFIQDLRFTTIDCLFLVLRPYKTSFESLSGYERDYTFSTDGDWVGGSAIRLGQRE